MLLTKTPDHLTLRRYQTEDVEFHLDNPKSANHSQPGTGKTAIAAETMMSDPTMEHILVACPDYLKPMWRDHIAKQYYPEQYQHMQRYPQDEIPDIAVCQGQSMDRISQIMARKKWTIINKEMFRTYPIPAMYDGVILDEAHHFANRNAKMTEAATELTTSPNTKRVIQLTATPVRKEPDDLYSQLRMLDPQTFSSYYDFVREYCYVSRGRYGMHVRGGRTQKIKEMLKEYAVAHTYSSVHLQLPRLIEYVDTLEMTPQMRKLYLTVKNTYRYPDLGAGTVKFLTNAMQVMTHLRRMTMCETKLEAIQDIVDDSDDAVVIYTWYREGAEKVAAHLLENSNHSVDVPIIDGSISAQKRAELAKGQKYIVATLAALSEGVDLSHARVVVFAESYWQPAMMYQAMSRVRRWSNDTRPVMVHYLNMENTIDEIVHKAHKERHATIESIIKQALED